LEGGAPGSWRAEATINAEWLEGRSLALKGGAGNELLTD
jgi:hypothetical protein